MKMNAKNLLFSLVMLVWCFAANATDYYVAKDGDDQNPGTETEPFLTISKAAQVAVAGDICNIKAGDYFEILNPSNAGTSGNPIVFKAYGNDVVKIKATKAVTGWTQYDGDIYKASAILNLGVERNVLFSDGEALEIARWPNNEDGDPFSFDGHSVTSGTASHISASGMPSIDWANGYVCYLGAHSGMSWTRKVLSSQLGGFDFEAVDITKWPFNPHNPTVYRNKNYGRFYLFGVLAALDYPGEWYYDEANTTVYCMLPERANPTDVTMEVTERLYTVQFEKNYLVLDGITCFGGVVSIKGNNCTIQNCKIQNCLQSLDELNNTDAQISNGAIYIEANNSVIENNLIEGGSGNGIAMLTAWKGSENMTVTKNVIRNFNSLGVHANPIRSNCSGAVIKNNTVYSCGRDGIYTSGANAEVAYNDVFDCMKINNDGGVFYTVGNADLKNSSIHHNWFHDSEGPEYADGRAAGIYLDNNSKGYDVHHNVIWNVTWSALMFNWNNTDLNFYNNSIWDAGSSVGRWANGYTVERIKLYNNYSNVPTETAGMDWIGTEFVNNVINAVSPFVLEQNGNFSLKSDAYLIDAGVEIPGFTDGYQGAKPDVGAYEYGLDRWMAGSGWLPDGEELPYIDAGIFSPKEIIGSLNVFPNPTSSVIRIAIEEQIGSPVYVDIYTISGKLVYSEKIDDVYGLSGGVELSNSKLPNGVYVVKASSSDKLFVGKVLVK